MSDVNVIKYNAAANICGNVYNMLKNKIINDNCLDIHQLYTLGMNEIEKQCHLIYKNVKKKGVAFPVSINLNNCIDNFIPTRQDTPISLIHVGDVIKIKLGVDIDGCIAMLCETFVYDKKTNYSDKYITFLNNLKKNLVKELRAENTNDEVKIFIESECTKNDCFPIINCKSYQHYDNQIYNENIEAKYMILNYHKLYDNDDYLIMDNICYEFLEDEVYTIDISIVPENDEDSDDETDVNNNIKNPLNPYITNLDISYLHRLTDNYYDFKLQSSKQFYSKVFSKYRYNVFDINEYSSDAKNKLGIRESKKIGVLNVLPVRYTKNKKPVYTSTFTIVIKRNKGLMLKYTN